MKTSLLYLSFLLLSIPLASAQLIIDNSGSNSNEVIQQISVPGIDDLLIFQQMNRGFSNYVFSQQTGNLNTANINQKNDVSSDVSNQSYTLQSGNSNEMTIGQMGSGNLLLGFQLSYLIFMTESGTENDFQIDNKNIVSNSVGTYEFMAVTENNKLSITQNGENNGAMVVQEGSNNLFSADQIGKNNYLFALQKGSYNMVTGYSQQNYSEDILYEKIIQVGDYNSLITSDASLSKLTGNIFTQTGSNLSLEVNNSLLNSEGGVEINQTGKDMKVVIDQSYFSFPMK